MRDEGAFLVEWVTWYRLLGFDDILIVTNDCSDASAQLIAALGRPGGLAQIDHRIPEGGIPLKAKLRRAKRHPLLCQAGWVFLCDVDEFLVIHRGQGRIGDLLPPPDQADFLGMAVNWRVFGDSGLGPWADGLVHRQFRRAAPPGHGVNRWHKSLFRRPDLFDRLGAHGPAGFLGPPESWGEAGLRWVNAAGQTLPNVHPLAEYQRMTPADLVDHRVAQINHYMIRWDESFGLKRGTLSPAALRDRYTDDFHHRFNRNEVADHSALARAAEFDRLHDQAMALPGVRRLHHLCCADYAARLARRAGRDPDHDPRRIHHLRLAAEG